MTDDDESGPAGHRRSEAGPAGQPRREAGPASQRRSEAGSHHRSWWRWLLVGLLLIFSLLITALYVTSLAADLLQHRWGEALDASRDAVPAGVGWAALLIIFFGPGVTPADRLLSADQRAVREKQARTERNEDSLRRAEQRVQDLTASLAALFACLGDAGERGQREQDDRDAAGPPSSPQLARQVAETTARLDQARQWLASARAALAASQHDVADATEKDTTEKDATEKDPTTKLAIEKLTTASPPSFPDPAGRPGCSEGRVGSLRRSRTKMSLAEVRTQGCPGLRPAPLAGSPRLHPRPRGP
ncbi:MAG TPA: hypothetical protein VME44_05300 [Streptosporangiaceae bacterium]|nr:hypothetical protein [Streptosporangiaceae bacterium]